MDMKPFWLRFPVSDIGCQAAGVQLRDGVQSDESPFLWMRTIVAFFQVVGMHWNSAPVEEKIENKALWVTLLQEAVLGAIHVGCGVLGSLEVGLYLLWCEDILKPLCDGERGSELQPSQDMRWWLPLGVEDRVVIDNQSLSGDLAES